jgi:hypothetical protein
MSFTLASVGDIWVTIVMLGTLANVSFSAGGVAAVAVSAKARIAFGWLLACCRTRTCPDGEVDHQGDTPGEFVGHPLIARQVCGREVVP